VRTSTRGPSGTELQSEATAERGPEQSALAEGILRLQRSAGNGAVARLLQRDEAATASTEEKGGDVETARKLFERGAAAFAKGQFAHAYDFFTQAYELAPRSGLVFSSAQALRQLGGRREEAIALYENYLNMPDITRQKDAEAALAELRGPAATGDEAIDVPEAKKLFERGAAAFTKGQFAHAYDFFTQAYELAPRSGLVFSSAQALRQLGGRREEAIALYEDYLNMPDITRTKDAEAALAELRGPAAAP
jgi:tetratricopeptide (TPR) repeat protein